MDVLDQLKTNKLSQLDMIYTNNDIRKIWETLARYIKKQLESGKVFLQVVTFGVDSVSIKNLGVFTLKEWEVDAGMYHSIKHFEPVFLLSKILLEQFNLHQRKEYSSDKIATAPINFHEISITANMNKGVVISGIDEVVQCLRKLISRGYDIILGFPEVGELKIIKTRIYFEFCKSLRKNEEMKRGDCERYPAAIAPYHKQNICPCSYHATTDKQT